MSAINYYEILSSEAKEEFVKLIKNKESAYDMVLSNYLGKQSYGYADISSRLELQYFLLNPNINNVQPKGTNGWLQYESNEPNEVADYLITLIETKDDYGIASGYYSSFAIKENKNKTSVSYSLYDDIPSAKNPFVEFNDPVSQYNKLVTNVGRHFDIAVGEVDYEDGNNVGYKAKASKKDKTTSLNNGVIILPKRTKKGYTITSIEKIVKIYDELVGLQADENLQSFNQQSLDKVTNDMKFAVRVFATILLSRVTDFENPQINATVEKCLWLQFANVINRSKFNSEQIKAITEFGADITSNIAVKLGYTKEDVEETMEQNNYSYGTEPTSLKEAFLFATESDYVKYAKPIYESVMDAYEERKHSSSYSVEDDKKLMQICNEIFKTIGPEPISIFTTGLSDFFDTRNRNDVSLAPGAPVLLGDGRYTNKTILPAQTNLLPSAQTNDKQDNGNGIDLSKNAVRLHTVSKEIDNIILKALSDKTVSILRRIGQKDYSEFGGKANCESANIFLSSVSTFYQYLQTSKKGEVPVRVQSHYDAQKIAIQLNKLKTAIASQIVEYSKYYTKNDREKLTTYINRAFMAITNNTNSIRDNFKKVINGYVHNYVGSNVNAIAD